MSNLHDDEMAFPSPEQFCVAGRGHYTYMSPREDGMSYNLEFKHDEVVDDWMSTIKVHHPSGEGAYFASLHRTFADAYESAFRHVEAEGGSNFIYQDDPHKGKAVFSLEDFKKTFAIKPPSEEAFIEQSQPFAQQHFQTTMPPTR